MAFGSGNFDGPSGGGIMSEINMTPLVDVMLVLLIIFMLTVPVITHSVKLDLPRADNRPDQDKPQVVSLAITQDGSLFWNDAAISPADFQAKLDGVAQQIPQPELHIRADRKVEYEHVAQAMAAAQKAGVLKLGFVTDPVH